MAGPGIDTGNRYRTVTIALLERDPVSRVLSQDEVGGDDEETGSRFLNLPKAISLYQQLLPSRLACVPAQGRCPEIGVTDTPHCNVHPPRQPLMPDRRFSTRTRCLGIH